MRVAIVNDSRTAIEAMRRVIVATAGLQVAWIAIDGDEAVRRCGEDVPDLVLMDLYMPRMDGVEATRQIMIQSPCPILIVTASVTGHSSKVFEALGAGALDVVKTPVLGGSGQMDGSGELKVKIAAVGRIVSDARGSPPAPQIDGTNVLDVRPVDQLVAIGASAGGPGALETILASLPATLAAAVVIIQHIDVQFAPSMTEWLENSSTLPVHAAADGDHLRPGHVFVAAAHGHLVLRDVRTLGYSLEPRKSFYRPSIDVFFDSILMPWYRGVTAVLLTGMGRDGARGLRRLKDAGAHTIAQDRASSVVYGMPKAAADLDAAVEILSLPLMAGKIAEAVSRRSVNARTGI